MGHFEVDSMNSRNLLFVAKVAILAVVYFGIVRLGVLPSIVVGHNTVVWPPTGLALAALLLFGPHFWPGIALGALLASVTTGLPFAVACGVSAGNTVEALFAVFLLRRVVRFHLALERLPDVLGLIGLAAGLSTMVSATIDVLSFYLGGVIPWDACGLLWQVWWLGGAMSDLVIAPLILTWSANVRMKRRRGRLAEIGALMVLLVLICLLVFGGWSGLAQIYTSLHYAVFPFIIWAALRFSPREAMTATFVVSAIALWGTAHGFGPFVQGTIPERISLLYTFLSVTATTALVMAAIETERKRAGAALRQAEEKYRSIVENAVEGICQTTPDGHYLSVNPALARIQGYETPEELMTTLTDIGGQLYVDASRRAELVRLLQDHRMVSGFESQIYRKNGEVIWIAENARAVRDTSGALLYYEGTVEDITQRKVAELALHDAKDAAEAANRTKSEFLATMSHELRTPLGVILGYTDLLLEDTFGQLEEKQTDTLRRIDRSARELLDLITAVLDLSRLEAGRLPFVTHETQVVRLLQEVQAETQTLQEHSRLTFAWDIEESLPMLHTDPGKLKIVLKNLIGNAVKFTATGSVRMTARSSQEGVEMSVTDTGIGIPQEALSVIFEPFHQIEHSATRRYGGTGLGLYIVKRLLDVLGGTITVESEVGRGSTFCVWMPQGKGPEEQRD